MPDKLTRAAVLLIASSVMGLTAAAAPGDWRGEVSRLSRGTFPDLRPLEATYSFSWSGFTAATAHVRFGPAEPDSSFLEGQARTFGLARVLWKFDLTYRSLVEIRSLRPREMHQLQIERRKRMRTDLIFSSTGVTRTRQAGAKMPVTGTYEFDGLNDLQSALLYIRSQDLADGDVYRVAIYPETTPYLATVTVLAHDAIKVGAGNYPAIKMDLRLQKVNSRDELEPHKKFKRAAIWLSNDRDRMLLRAEAQIFIGTVATELQSIHFEPAGSSPQWIHSPRTGTSE